ncbi:MAG: hypothetical protein DWQ06_09930 [Calditrichaeota bacterium]|nr:MAG: hypothetical protein DWQ06_09930 [Calditrichota bacterium]
MQFLIFIIFIFCFSCSKTSNLEKEVYEYEQKRETDLEKLNTFLSSKDENIRAKTYLAIGRIQDSLFVSPLKLAFENEQNDSLKSLSAWALGQIKTQESLEFLMSRLQTEQSEKVIARLVEATGKVAIFDSTQAFENLLKIYSQILLENSELIKGEIGKSLGILYRGKKSTPTNLQIILEEQLPKVSSEHRWKLIYPFLFFSKPNFDKILPFVKDENPITRAYAIQILANTGNDSTVKIIENLKNDFDWRVRVSATSSLKNFRNSALTGKLLLSLLDDKNKLVRSTAIQICGELKFAASIPKLKEITKQENYFLKNEAFLSLAKIWNEPKEDFFSKLKVSPDWRERVTYLKTLEVFKNYSSAVEIINFYKDEDSRVVAEAVSRTKPYFEILLKERGISSNQAKILKEAFELAILDVLSNTKDWSVIYVCTDEILKMDNLKNSQPLQIALEVLQNPKSQNELEALILVVNALGKFKEQKAMNKLESLLKLKDKNLSLACAEALEKITGNPDFKSKIQEGELFRKFFDFNEISELKSQKITLKTTSGKLIFQTFPKSAPQTVLNFKKLVENNFYSGVNFHRVIPNFVSQTGDPNGNGWGGINHQLNCEYNLFNYEIGTVGMALAGKDTGGSQFFITHLPQPHLNGKYSIFGRVVLGEKLLSEIDSETEIKRVIIEN